MGAELFLQFLQNLVSAGYVLGGFVRVLFRVGFGWRWHGRRLRVQPNSIQDRLLIEVVDECLGLARGR